MATLAELPQGACDQVSLLADSFVLRIAALLRQIQANRTQMHALVIETQEQIAQIAEMNVH